MTTAGELSHKVGFFQRTTVVDAYGNEQSAFPDTPAFVVSAKVQAKFGGEAVTAARLSGQQPVQIVVRQSALTATVTTDWQARDERSLMVYNIRSIADPTDAGKFFEMLCQSGVAT